MWEQQADDERLTPCKRTSGRLAVYSHRHAEPSAGLLLDIVGDPGGHAIFNREDPVYAQLLRAWDRPADRHQDVGLSALSIDVTTLERGFRARELDHLHLAFVQSFNNN